MAQTSFPFDNSDSWEAQWTKMAQYWLATGVIKGVNNELQVYADSTGMQVKTKTGVAWVKGHYYENSDTEVVLPIATASAANPRIDRIVLRLDWTTNSILLAVLTGTPAASPVAPALTQNTNRWEISLAQVYVAANTSTIAAGNITDERTFTSNANSNQPSWLALTMQNGWLNNAGSQWQAAQYMKDTLGFVVLRGSIANGTATNGTIITTLPVGYRPSSQLMIPMLTWNGGAGAWQNSSLSINPDGTIKCDQAVNIAHVALNGIRFKAEQ